jgi:pimeloyl-ACP methyl ester carboxylesterase
MQPQPRSIVISHPTAPSLHLLDWGGSGPVCLLIHGFADGAFVWNEFAPLLTPYARTLALDLRGHGESQWDPERRYNCDVHTNDVLRVVDSLELKNLILLGHSMGGEIAARTARLAPDRAIGLVLVDFSLETNLEAVALMYDEFQASNRIYDNALEYASWLRERRPLATPRSLEMLATYALKLQPSGGFKLKRDPWMAPLMAGNDASSYISWTTLAQVFCPTLIIRAEGSAILTKAAANRMLATLPKGLAKVVPASGHAVMTDNAEGFAAATLPFITQLVNQKY